MTAARVRLPGGVGPAERSVPPLLVHLAGRRGRVTGDHAHVGAVTCLSPAVVLRALDRLPALGLRAPEGQTLVLTTPAGGWADVTTHRAAPVAGGSDEGQGTKSRGAPDPSPTVGLVCDGFGGCWTTVQEMLTLVRHVIEPHDEDDAAARLGWAAGMVHAGAGRGTVVTALTLAAEAAGLPRRDAEAILRTALHAGRPS